MFLEMRVGEGSHAARSPPDAGLGRRDSLDSSLPLVERLPSLDRFLPRFSAHTCPSGFNQPAKPVTRCVLGKRRQKEPRPPRRPGLPARRVPGRRGPWGLALKEHSGRGGGPAGRGGPSYKSVGMATLVSHSLLHTWDVPREWIRRVCTTKHETRKTEKEMGQAVGRAGRRAPQGPRTRLRTASQQSGGGEIRASAPTPGGTARASVPPGRVILLREGTGH